MDYQLTDLIRFKDSSRPEKAGRIQQVYPCREHDDCGQLLVAIRDPDTGDLVVAHADEFTRVDL